MRPAISPARLWLPWIVANAAGELAGLGVIAVVATKLHDTLPPAPFALTVVALGVYQGAMIGFAQWTVLRRRFPALHAHRWVAATVIGAVAAWAFGMSPGTAASVGGATAGPELELPKTLLVRLTAFGGAFAGAILGAAQWVVLRRLVGQAGWWIPANALAWAVSMPLLVIGEMKVIAIAMAGAVAGAIHGAVLVTLTTPVQREESV